MKHQNTLKPERYDQLMSISRDYLESEVAELLSIKVETLHQTLYRRKYSDLFKGHYKLGATTYFKNQQIKNFFQRYKAVEVPVEDFSNNPQMLRVLGEKTVSRKKQKTEQVAYAQ